MEKLKDIFRLVHVPTLFIIAMTQLMMYAFVIQPFLEIYRIPPSMQVVDLCLLILACVCFAAGGFVINDYFDMKIDQINRPLTRIVGRTIEKHTAMTIYMAVTAAGILFAILLCWRARSMNYAMVLLFAAGILWFYSSSYKRILWLGNFIVAFLMALVPLVVALFQNQFMLLEYSMSPDADFLMSGCLKYTSAFSALMFGWTFVIEVVKDMSTEKGDRELECHTFPIVWGIKKTKILLYVWITIMWIVSGFIVYQTPELHASSSLRFFACAMVIPAWSLYYIIAKAQNAGDYKLIVQYLLVILAVNMAYSAVLF